jgi:hypothetical protein
VTDTRPESADIGRESDHRYLITAPEPPVMTRTRRSLLAAILAGTAGCLGGGSNVRYPATGTDGGGDPDPDAGAGAGTGGTPRSDGDEAVATPGEVTPEYEPVEAVESSATEQAAAPRTVPNPRLAAATRRIYREVRWFAGQYDPAIANFRRATRRAGKAVAEAAAAMEREGGGYGPLTDRALASIRGEIAAARRTTDRWLGDQFVTDDHLADETAYHLRTVARFKRRGDHDRVAEQLRNLSRFLYGVSRDAFVRSVMPAHPIQNRLVGWLRGGPNRTTAFAVRYPAGNFATRVYSGLQVDVVGRPVAGDRRRTFESEFAAARSADATDALYLRSYLPDLDRITPTADRDGRIPEVPRRWTRVPTQPILCQRFPDVRAAAAARESLVAGSGPLTVDGRYPFAGVDWKRVYWTYDGDVTYAFLAQAGEFLLSMAPSRTAWEERVDWRGPLEPTFLGPGPADGTGNGNGDGGG